ncbi:hypothetical protein BDN67DRAFT_969767 [Paxillus ammoniavirescens]|nr:hypothetical protein BDN67DRAFT_969767 [Paxillus ammoniavirescens]
MFTNETAKLLKTSTGSLLFTIINLSLPATITPTVYLYPALQSGLPVGTTVVSVCHAMLRISGYSITLK